MNLDAEVLARVQFAFTVTFHIIFPTMSIGLAAFLMVVEGLWLKTRDPVYLEIYRFWMGIFAMGFGVGVVTGIVLSSNLVSALQNLHRSPARRLGQVSDWKS